MYGRGSEQTIEMKLGQKGVALSGPAYEPAGGQKIYGIPDTVITDEAVEGGGYQHLQSRRRCRP